MKVYQKYDKTTKQPVGRPRPWLEGQEPIDSPKRKIDAAHVWVELVDAPLPSYDPEIEQLNKLPDNLDESESVWVLTSNLFEVAEKVEAPPIKVTRAQFFEEMIQRDLDEEVDAIVLGTNDKSLINWYNNALHYEHGNERIEAINSMLSNPVDLDQFFINAAKHTP